MPNNAITSREVEERLTEQLVAYARVPLGEGWIIVSSLGARIYGPFFEEAAGASNWLPAAFSSREEFASLVASGHWNLGGERIWIGPEIQYMIPDRTRYWASYTMPASMDPGENSFEVRGDTVTLHRVSNLEAFTVASGSVDVALAISVRPEKNPLRYLSRFAELSDGVSFAGYSSTVHLEQDSESPLASESWNLAQVNPGGTVLLPCSPELEVTDYYEPIGDLFAQDGRLATARITGDQRYKVGFKAAHVFGRVGYLADAPDGGALLLVRNFHNDPSSLYAEEPDFTDALHGDSIHLYNDDGGLGGFGELEARGRTVGADTGQSRSEDRFTSWWFTGPRPQLDAIARALLG